MPYLCVIRRAYFRDVPAVVLTGLVMLLAGCGSPGTSGPGNPPPPPPPPPGLSQVNHIIIMAQENRGFEHYFGGLRQYWAANGFRDQSFDGLPQFNPATGASPLVGSAPTNPGCDPAFPSPGTDCTITANSPQVESFPMISMCEENPSPSWNESHVIWNLKNPLSPTATLDGFVWTAAHDSRNLGFFDVDGKRAMSYYNGTDLPYYYFMASNFATSDRWFAPVMTRTPPNRMYMLAGTSAGHAYGLSSGDSPASNTRWRPS